MKVSFFCCDRRAHLEECVDFPICLQTRRDWWPACQNICRSAEATDSGFCGGAVECLVIQRRPWLRETGLCPPLTTLLRIELVEAILDHICPVASSCFGEATANRGGCTAGGSRVVRIF